MLSFVSMLFSCHLSTIIKKCFLNVSSMLVCAGQKKVKPNAIVAQDILLGYGELRQTSEIDIKCTHAPLVIVTRNQIRNISGPPSSKHLQKI